MFFFFFQRFCWRSPCPPSSCFFRSITVRLLVNSRRLFSQTGDYCLCPRHPLPYILFFRTVQTDHIPKSSLLLFFDKYTLVIFPSLDLLKLWGTYVLATQHNFGCGVLRIPGPYVASCYKSPPFLSGGIGRAWVLLVKLPTVVNVFPLRELPGIFLLHMGGIGSFLGVSWSFRDSLCFLPFANLLEPSILPKRVPSSLLSTVFGLSQTLL